MSHTPGPWTAHHSEKTISIDSRTVSAKIATLPRRSISINRQTADAYLIAAAPDLLAACRAVAGVFQDSNDPPLYAQKCIAAIAKATREA